MKRLRLALSPLILALGLFSGAAFADAPNTYQVTGKVTALDDTKITVVKGKENFEIARDKETKVTGELKVGSKVTVMYRMTAASIESKSEAPAAKKSAGKKKK